MRLVSHAIVAIVVAILFSLGVWQLDRARWKEALLAEYEAAADKPAVDFPYASEDPPLFRRSSATCDSVNGWRDVTGANEAGRSGYVHVATCTNAAGDFAVETGWSTQPTAGRGWDGGDVSGVIGPDGTFGYRLVSSEGLGGLEASAPPSPDAVRNNHRSYAVQWFIFAFLAAGIYLLALRKKIREEKADG